MTNPTVLRARNVLADLEEYERRQVRRDPNRPDVLTEWMNKMPPRNDTPEMRRVAKAEAMVLAKEVGKALGLERRRTRSEIESLRREIADLRAMIEGREKADDTKRHRASKRRANGRASDNGPGSASGTGRRVSSPLG